MAGFSAKCMSVLFMLVVGLSMCARARDRDVTMVAVGGVRKSEGDWKTIAMIG